MWRYTALHRFLVRNGDGSLAWYPEDDPARLASGPTHARAEPGIPYPLIALGALSLVLLASGLAAGLARRRT